MNIKNMCAVALSMACFASCNQQSASEEALDFLGIGVTAEENREYSYTDKQAGFWYGHTHADEPLEYYSGWNVAKKRILSDYALLVDGKQLKRAEADTCVVYPHKIGRTWSNAKEELRLVDMAQILYVKVGDVKGEEISITLNRSLIDRDTSNADNMLVVRPKEMPETVIKVAPSRDCAAHVVADTMLTAKAAETDGFIIVHGTESQCDSLINAWRTNGAKMLEERVNRMTQLIVKNCPTTSNLPELDKALAWITLTMDELITEQQGKGIYAGLPWFNEYWGRDMFIAMPGATLVTGQFEYTADILRDFAKFQDKDTTSITCGRIPNRANLEGILYNTADGTPRYVMEAEELLRYWGNRSFLEDIYPTIVLSIDQAIKKQIDEKGYLKHEDADTWMDVKRNGIPGSPRGNRANDIQYLWYCELMSGSRMALMMNDAEHAQQWKDVADRLAQNFETDFCDKNSVLIYDHLNNDNTPDMQFRPNQLFCFDLIKDDTFKQKVTARVWQELVYPWGVASLTQTDEQFHPQHENWHYYHKDDAYHNGTIWLWNNGIAMQRMIEYGQVEMAWQLFKNMNRQALKEGAVGSLSENADAHPREGQSWVKRSGTFLQAWSNSEQLRVWYQYFLGIRPDLMNGVIVVEPRLPKEITTLSCMVIIGNGQLLYSYNNGKCEITLHNLPDVKVDLREGAVNGDNPIFKGIDFCKPNPLPSYPCFATYHDPALTY